MLVVRCCAACGAAVACLGSAVVVLVVGAGFDGGAAVKDLCETVEVVVAVAVVGGAATGCSCNGFRMGAATADGIVGVIMLADDALTGAVDELLEVVVAVVLVAGAVAIGLVCFFEAAAGVKQEVDLFALASGCCCSGRWGCGDGG